ncbi:MAG: hypothetical protein CM15mV43_600 [uncultured marine virus]|nr:MAG: hypothetical protein CM15mV43_600 [uncultured marine virus]
MTKYIVKENSILYKEVEADSPEEAEEIALGEPVHQAEEYVEVEEERRIGYDSLFSYWSCCL